MQLIQTVTVGSGGAASIEFTSIPTDGTYTDLYLVLSNRQTQTFGDSIGYPGIRFNNSSSTYTTRYLRGNGTDAASAAGVSYLWVYGNNAAQTANTFSNTAFYIPNYTSSSAKSVSADAVSENNATTAFQFIMAGLWSGTSAISSIQIYALDSGLNNTPSFVEYTSASLYGIKSGSDGIVTVS